MNLHDNSDIRENVTIEPDREEIVRLFVQMRRLFIVRAQFEYEGCFEHDDWWGEIVWAKLFYESGDVIRFGKVPNWNGNSMDELPVDFETVLDGLRHYESVSAIVRLDAVDKTISAEGEVVVAVRRNVDWRYALEDKDKLF